MRRTPKIRLSDWFQARGFGKYFVHESGTGTAYTHFPSQFPMPQLLASAAFLLKEGNSLKNRTTMRKEETTAFLPSL